jgi:hypothetical protein
VKLPLLARDSLNQQTRIIVNEYAHSSFLDFYFYIENLALQLRSEIDGSALEFCV